MVSNHIIYASYFIVPYQIVVFAWKMTCLTDYLDPEGSWISEVAGNNRNVEDYKGTC